MEVFPGAIVARFCSLSHGTWRSWNHLWDNPLACTAALAVLSTILEEGILETVKDKGEYFTDQLIKLKNKFSFIKEVRGKGLMLGVELDEEVSGKEIVLDMLNRGFIINCAGNNTLRFVPPLIIQKDHIDDLVENLEKSFSRESYDA